MDELLTKKIIQALNLPDDTKRVEIIFDWSNQLPPAVKIEYFPTRECLLKLLSVIEEYNIIPIRGV